MFFYFLPHHKETKQKSKKTLTSLLSGNFFESKCIILRAVTVTNFYRSIFADSCFAETVTWVGEDRLFRSDLLRQGYRGEPTGMYLGARI